MRELTYLIAVSLDGYIAAPDDAFDAFLTEGDHVDHLFAEWSDTLPAAALTAAGAAADNKHFDTVVMGWQAYAVGFPFGVTDPYPHLRSYVVTHRPEREVPGDPGGVTLTGEDPVALVRRLKQEDGSGIWLCGGSRLAATLADEIDRLVLKVHPILLGEGKPLFAQRPYARTAFALAETRSFTTGVLMNTYVRR